MWESIIPYHLEVGEQWLNEAVLPKGYTADFISEGRFNILNAYFVKVGMCETAKDSLVFKFCNDRREGLTFASAFAVLYPDYNPAQHLTGFLFEGRNGLYSLEMTPLRLGELIMDKLVKYVANQRIYYVIFYRGDLSADFLSVFSMRRITFDNQLGDDLGENTLPLGKIEDN